MLTGLALQCIVGKISWSMMASPVNAIVLATFVAMVVLMHLLRKRVYAFQYLSTYHAAIASLSWAVVLTIVMGLTRQAPSSASIGGLMGVLGIEQMLSAWHFVLVYTWLTLVLGLTILRVLSQCLSGAKPGKELLRRTPFLLNHLGLFIAITAATLGNADMQRLQLQAELGQPEWRATPSEHPDSVVELPLAIQLHEFALDEYPPKLMMSTNTSGKVLPVGNPQSIVIEDSVASGELLGWQVRVTRSIEEAAETTVVDSLATGADSVKVDFVPFHSMGYVFAAWVEADSANVHREGWVSCGNFMFPFSALKLGDYASIFMAEREPKRYASDVTVYVKDGDESGHVAARAVIEVNKPLEVEGWKIYQLSFNERLGKWSEYSVFELVRDPWLPGVYVGIFMMLAGALFMFLGFSSKRNDKQERRTES